MIMHPDIGVLNGGKCYVFLEGYGLHREPMYGSYEECLNAIDARGGVDDPIPTDGSHSMTDYKAALAASKPAIVEVVAPTPAPKARATKGRWLREYTVSIIVAEKLYAGTCVIDSYEITACAMTAMMRYNRGVRNGVRTSAPTAQRRPFALASKTETNSCPGAHPRRITMSHHTEEFLSVIDSKTKAVILESIAVHYGITPDEALAEVIDEEAEHLLDYLVEPQRGATSFLMQRYGMRGY
jgi:hypothetical protein